MKTYFETAVEMGALDEPIPERDQLLMDLDNTMRDDIKFYRDTDAPQTYCVITPKIDDCRRYAASLNGAGIPSAVTTAGDRNLADVMRLMSAGKVSVVFMPTQTACVGGFRWPSERVKLISLEAMRPEFAVRFLGIAVRSKHHSALVWLKQPRKPLMGEEKVALRYSNLLIELEDDKTEAELDALVQHIHLLKGVKAVHLGSFDYADRFVTEQRVTREISQRVYDALNPPRKQE